MLSFETLERHPPALPELVAAPEALADADYVALYIGVVALSLPIGAYLTVIGGMLFGAVLGGTAAVIGASIGAVVVFFDRKECIRPPPGAARGRNGREDRRGLSQGCIQLSAFSAAHPGIPVLAGQSGFGRRQMRLAPFAAATVLGIMPATFAFAFVGSGLDSVIVAQEASRAPHAFRRAAPIPARLPYRRRTHPAAPRDGLRRSRRARARSGFGEALARP